MAKDLASNKINDELFSNTDPVFTGATVPVSGEIVSPIFEVGKTLDALEIVGLAGTGVADITGVEYRYSDDPDFASPETIVVQAVAAPADGEEFFRFVPDHTKPVYAKIAILGGASGAGTVDVKIGSVRKG